jgi:hypothetical protein
LTACIFCASKHRELGTIDIGFAQIRPFLTRVSQLKCKLQNQIHFFFF